MIYFISDTHFSHHKIIDYCDRPVQNATEMDELMLENINTLVKPTDELYHLGDFGIGGWSNMTNILRRIKCKNLHFIKGNHDKNMDNDNVKAFFKTFSYYKELNVNKQLLCLSHYPMAEWNSCHRGSYMLHGHSHGSLSYEGPIKNKKILDVGVDVHNMKPISLDEVHAIMSKRDIYKYPDRKYTE